MDIAMYWMCFSNILLLITFTWIHNQTFTLSFVYNCTLTFSLLRLWANTIHFHFLKSLRLGAFTGSRRPRSLLVFLGARICHRKPSLCWGRSPHTIYWLNSNKIKNIVKNKWQRNLRLCGSWSGFQHLRWQQIHKEK